MFEFGLKCKASETLDNSKMIWKEIFSVYALVFSEYSGPLDEVISENVPESLMVLSENCCPDIKILYISDSSKACKGATSLLSLSETEGCNYTPSLKIK